MNTQTLITEIEKCGISMLSDSKKIDRASNAANTYIFNNNDRQYIVDPAYGKQRRQKIKKSISMEDQFDILCTHYHNDHSANNGKIARKDTRIFYHHKIKNKIDYFRTNGTGQVVMMGEHLDLQDMLKRFRMFPNWLVSIVMLLSSISKIFPTLFLFIISYLYSWRNIGRIDPGKTNAAYLNAEDIETISLDNMEVLGWQIDDNLIAIDAPGHTDDHLLFYLTDKKTLFVGDSLNFLNANDIQFGDIKKVNDVMLFLIELIEKEQVSILLQGHYYPVIGTDQILTFVSDIRDKHDEVFKITSEVISSMASPLKFEEVYQNLCDYPAAITKGLARVTFPRSTLVFLDVYLFKVLQELGWIRQSNGEWVNPKIP